jgi:peptide chain release factor 2
LPRQRSTFDVAGKRRRLTELQEQVSDPSLWDNQEQARQLTSELGAIEDDLALIDRFERRLDDVETLDQLAVSEDDAATAAEVEGELAALERDFADLEIRVLLSGEYDSRDAVVSVQAGAGGTDSQDWAEMLLRMLLRWADRRGFQVDVHDQQESEEAGIRSATMTLRGPRAYGLAKAEAGVHRLVRISPFDAQKRRHTAFASVDVVPVLEEVDDVIEVADEDLRIDTFRSSGPGGQSVNTTDSAVRLNHLPTGIVVSCQDQKSQLQNKTVAMKVLKAKLAELERQKRQQELDALRGDQHEVAWGSQIRSYVLHPYQMVKDHRTGHQTSNTQAVLDGEIDEFITAYLEWQARQRQEAGAAQAAQR